MRSLRMVDISSKEKSLRWAVAEGKVILSPQTREKIEEKKISKGNVLEAAEVAGILAAKRVPEFIPLAHPVKVEEVKMDFSWQEDSLKVISQVKGEDKTGMELEALMSVLVSCLTIYDMCKGEDPRIIIQEIKLVEKGK